MTDMQQDAFRLSPQQRLRWLSSLGEDCLTLEIRGPLDSQWLAARLQQMIAEQDSLRLQLKAAAGLKVPLQAETPAADFSFNTDGPAASCGYEQALSAGLKTLGTEHYRLEIRLSPLISDRGTLQRFARQLFAAEAPQADEDAMTYPQFAGWLYELQEDEDAAEAQRYWATQLDKCQAAVRPVYRENTTARPDAGQVQLDLPVDLQPQIAAFCAARDCSEEQLLCTAWQLTLQRLCDGLNAENALLLNWLHDSRDDYEELEDCWGMFTKSLPLVYQPAAETSFSAAVEAIAGLQEEAGEWQEYYAIEQEAGYAHSQFGFEWAAQPALLQGTVNQQGAPLQVNVADLQTAVQAFELLLVVRETAAAEKRLNLRYSAGYSQQSMQVLLSQFVALLRDGLQQPEQSWQQLALHSAAFNSALNVSQALPVTPAYPTFASAFQEAAAAFAEFTAVTDQSALADESDGHFERQRSWSYRQLDQLTNQLARQLQQQGVGCGSRVALYLPRCNEMILAIIAVLKAGGAFVPLETQHPDSRNQSIIQASQPQLVITFSEFSEIFPDSSLCLLDDETSWQQQDSSPLEQLAAETDEAYLLFTSGSTGTPKGVSIGNRQLSHYTGSVQQRLSLQAGESCALVTSLAADLSYTLLFSGLLSGCNLQLVDKDTVMTAAGWADYCQAQPVDHLKVVPSLLEAWLNDASADAVLPAKQLIIGGEPCRAELISQLTARLRQPDNQLAIYNHYGPTETTVGVLLHQLNATDDAVLPLTETLGDSRICLLDKQLQPVAPGEAAELYIAGPQLADGYLDESQTRARFIDHPALPGVQLYRSGDLARFRADGRVEILGRADRQVKLRGFRIELDEIEAVAAQLAGIRQAAVEIVERANGQLQIFAFLTPQPGAAVVVAELQQQLQQQLPDYMLPTLRLVDNLPLMANGKLDRAVLREWGLKMLSHACQTPPRNGLETLLCEQWASVLGVEKVGIDDDFFALGGHSLAAVKLVSRLQKLLATEIPVNSLFSAPTVMAFAAVLQNKTLPPLVEISSGGSRQLFCLHSSNGHVQDYQHLAELLPDWQIWGLQASYLNAEMPAADLSIARLASDYVAEIRAQQPEGPYYLLGWSLGGLLAASVAEQLEQAGQQVAFLGLVDSQTGVADADDPDSLLSEALALLDDASQVRARDLLNSQRSSLEQQLQNSTADSAAILVEWAQQQGLQLAGQSWDYLLASRKTQRFTLQLLNSFELPQLQCAVYAWWASESLQDSAFRPAQWARSATECKVAEIAAEHMTILQSEQWQTQLQSGLQQAVNGTQEMAQEPG